jgi:hypothetical protein
MAPAETLKVGGGHLLGGTAAQNDFRFLRYPAGFEMAGGADDDGRLRRVSKTALLGRQPNGISFARLTGWLEQIMWPSLPKGGRFVQHVVINHYVRETCSYFCRGLGCSASE